MAFKLGFLVYTSSVLLVLVLILCAQGFPKKSSKTHDDHTEKLKIVAASLGATCKLRCKIPTKRSKVVWLKDGILFDIRKSNGYEIKRRFKQKQEVLKISKMTFKHGGCYTCMVKKHKLGSWKLMINNDRRRKCRRPRRDTSDTKLCGTPEKVNLNQFAICNTFIFPKCPSYAGQPLAIDTAVVIHKNRPAIQIDWKPPETGYSSLWGYQVSIVGLRGHAGYSRCSQINDKNNLTYWKFNDNLHFDAVYEISIRSMPSKDPKITKILTVKEKCQYSDISENEANCCTFRHLNFTVNAEEGKISVSWNIDCLDKKITVKRYQVTWTNLVKVHQCSDHSPFLQTTLTENPRVNYTIFLSNPQCRKYNFSIWALDVDHHNKTTRKVRIIVAYPPREITIAPVMSQVEPRQADVQVIVSICGALLGITLVAMLVIYKCFFTKVIIKLPKNQSHSDGQTPSVAPLIDSSGRPNKVFLMHAHCCEKCKWVVVCLGKLLNSTGLVEARSDVWAECEIATCVLRWYEEEIRDANCVVVLASDKMSESTRYKNIPPNNNSDPLHIAAQLNLVCGEITRDPNSPKFIPAYFTYSGEPSHVPLFLNSRLTHKLPNDLNRLVYHALHIEAIQPHRTQAIAVLGGDGHPFERFKADLLRAVTEAEEEHRLRSDRNNLNLLPVA